MNTVLTGALLLLKIALPAILKDSGITTRIIQGLVTLVPLAIKEAHDVLPMIQNIINGFTKAGGITDSDLDDLDLLSAQIDAAFEAAVARKVAEGNANG